MRAYLFPLAGLMLATVCCTTVKTPVDLADPFVGTGFHGHTYPGATAPQGMVQLSPDTRDRTWDGSSGYHESDKTILGFSHTHLSGTGCADLGDFLFTPALGEVATKDGAYAVDPIPFTHADEMASPGYYRVRFPDPGVTVELTATPHTGVHRYTFTGKGERHILIDLKHNIGETHPREMVFQTVGDTLVQGSRIVDGWTLGRHICFSAAFSVPFTACDTKGADRWLLTFPAETEELTVKVGISPVDMAGAENNRLAEAAPYGFDEIRAATRFEWARKLGAIAVEGGTLEQRKTFYSALYHTMVTPDLQSDVDGRYRNHAKEVVRVPEGRKYYSTLSLWDTFRSWNPLQMLLSPDLVEDMVFSLLDMYDCDGRLPMWPLGQADTYCMIGYHAVPVIADAWLCGIRTFDGEKALAAMIASSNLDPASAAYNQYGYAPCDGVIESVSKTLEFAYDDWCIARMAESLGHQDIAAEYDARSLRYRNLFDTATGFIRGRQTDGNWRAPFRPLSSSRDFTEAIPWQSRFFAPHDFAGFTALMGGTEPTHAALDSLFTYDERDPEMDISDITGFMGQYAHGNEPSHASAWMYNWLGDPARSQKVVRDLLETMYAPTPEGICGNEDCGQMSAWYVLSALGIYPVCPGSGEFVFAAPLFPKTTVTLGNGKILTILADHPEHPYIKDITFNGKSIDRQYITYEELMQGGDLSFTLSATPDHGRDALPAPYSLTDGSVVSTPALIGNPRFYKEILPVTLTCRTEGATIRYTLDGTEPTEASALYEGPFNLENKDCILSAKAFKEGLEPSGTFRVHVFPIVYREARTVRNPQAGCAYTYHLGTFTCTADVLASPIVSRGTMPQPSIEGAPDEDHFGYVFTGLIDVPSDGLWEFALASDDGAVLYIDGEKVVDNDGSHSAFLATGLIPLRKGLHAFQLPYLEDYEGQSLRWGWKAPGEAQFIPIPETAICH